MTNWCMPVAAPSLRVSPDALSHNERLTRKETSMYIGGGLVTILLVVLIIYFIRRA